MKLKYFLIFIAAAVGFMFINCGDSDEDDASGWEELRDGVPSKESLTLKMPETSEETAALFFGPETKFIAAPGQPGEFYISTVQITREVNLGVMGMLTFLDEVLTYPPTEEENGKAIWGPFPPDALEPVEIRVIIEKTGDNKFEFSFEARPKSSEDEWMQWYFGENTTDGKTARHGMGSFTVDWDAMREYNPTVAEEGKIKVVYDTITSGRTIDVEFIDFKGKDDEEKINADYHYKENADMSGEFDFIAKADIHKDMEDGAEYPKKEDWLFNTRWLSTGAGRSDVTITGGDIEAYCIWAQCLERAVFSECWGVDFFVDYSIENYYSQDDEIMNSEKEAGDESACVFDEKTYE